MGEPLRAAVEIWIRSVDGLEEEIKFILQNAIRYKVVQLAPSAVVFRLIQVIADNPSPVPPELIELLFSDAEAEDSHQWISRSPFPKRQDIQELVTAGDAINFIVNAFAVEDSSEDASRRLNQAAMQPLIDEEFEKWDQLLEVFISEPTPSPLWNPNSKFSSLKIPLINDKPSLLLHNLGQMANRNEATQKAINTLASTISISFLVNTSGSGKTRLLYELLTQHWGLYFVALTSGTPGNPKLGSSDLVNAVERLQKLTLNLDGVTNAGEKCRENERLAAHQFGRVFLARLLVFRKFLDQCDYLEVPRNQQRLKWLYLQLQPEAILGSDIFNDLTFILRQASAEFLEDQTGLLWKEIRERLFKPHSSLPEEPLGLLTVLDSAQHLANKLQTAFLSANGLAYRPVLRPLVRCWNQDSDNRMILSGTGLTKDQVSDEVSSTVGKESTFRNVFDLGSFDSQETHSKYLADLFWPDGKPDSAAADKLLERCWNLLNGQYGLTATFAELVFRHCLTDLMECTDYRNIHALLNHYVPVLSST